MSAFKKIGEAFAREVKEANTLLRRAGLLPPDSALYANFKRYGETLGITEYSEFVAAAKKFFEEGTQSGNELYTAVKLDYNRVAVDYNGEMRGIFTTKGTPLAFFRPDFRQLGFATKEMEMAAFKNGQAFRIRTNEYFNPSQKQKVASQLEEQ